MSGSKRQTALIVEDDPGVADAIQDVLSESFNVECVASAPAAIASLRLSAPEVMMIDCSLAGDRISSLLENVDSTQTAIILMSGDFELLPELSAFLGCPCLCKPFGTDTLWKAVDMALRRCPIVAQSRECPDPLADT